MCVVCEVCDIYMCVVCGVCVTCVCARVCDVGVCDMCMCVVCGVCVGWCVLCVCVCHVCRMSKRKNVQFSSSIKIVVLLVGQVMYLYPKHLKHFIQLFF